MIHIFFINSPASGGLGFSPALNISPQNKLLQARRKGRMPIPGISVLALFPCFLSPFLSFAAALPWVGWGELPAPRALPAAAGEGGTKAACAALGDS